MKNETERNSPEYWAERLPLIEAFIKGEELEVLCCGGNWRVLNTLSFKQPVREYRIKPKPQKRWVRWCKRKGFKDWIFDGWAITKEGATCPPSNDFDIFISEVEIVE